MREKILALLRAADGTYLSGEAMAEKLGISRTAVWKHIQELRKLGYDIVSTPRSGYTLKGTPDHLSVSDIQYGLDTKCIGRKIIFAEEVASTNTEAKRQALEGVPEGTVVIAEQQTGGKGRLARSFFSPKGKGLWFSVILRPKFPPQEAPHCTLMAAVAVARAMVVFGLQPQIKWPNDLLYDNRKLVGILTEMSADVDHIDYVVIGTGINVNIMPEDFPEDIRDKATSLAIMKGEKIPRVQFLQEVLRAMDDLYAKVQEQGFAPVMQEWKQYNITLGKEVRVIGVRTGEVFYGKAIDIDADGALIVEKADGTQEHVLAGDVSIRPSQD